MPGSRQGPVQTTIIKGKYDAAFGESFYFPIDPAQSRRAPELILAVLDWDRLGANDRIGSVSIVLGEGTDPRRNYLRAGQHIEYHVLSPGGSRVVGHDKQVRGS